MQGIKQTFESLICASNCHIHVRGSDYVAIVIYIICAGTTNSGGELTNFARIYNCTFQENRGVEFGAAISMTSLLFLTNSENARPLEIVDR